MAVIIPVMSAKAQKARHAPNARRNMPNAHLMVGDYYFYRYILYLYFAAAKHPRTHAVTAKKTPTPRVKKEPVSPPKKGGKCMYAETVDISDNDPESKDNGHSNLSTSGSSTHLYPIIKIPQVRRSNHGQIAGSSKKVQIDPPGDQDVTTILETQFQIIAEAFRTMSEVIGKL